MSPEAVLIGIGTVAGAAVLLWLAYSLFGWLGGDPPVDGTSSGSVWPRN